MSEIAIGGASQGTLSAAPEHILAANLAALERTSPRAARAIAAARPHPLLDLTTAEDGAVCATLDAKALASQRRPLEEARRLAQTADLDKAGTVVVLGFALGHHVAALAERAREVSAIVVYEPDVSLLRAVLERIDHSEWMSSTRFLLVTEADNAPVLMESLRGLEAALAVGVDFLVHPASRARLADGAARFSETFARVLQSVRTHIITTMVQTDVTVRNELMNIGHYASCPGVRDLAASAVGRPAIVVSAGPSLRRNIEALKTPGLRDRCVIIAVQTVLRQLLREGIRPHFVTAIDYHEISKRFYEGLTLADVEGVTLIAEARANPAILDAFPGNIRVPRDDYLTHLLAWNDEPDRGAFTPAATVAHLAYYVARHMGADPVILAGQDLAFTDGQYYAKGAAIHDVWATELNTFNTLEMMEWQRIVRTRGTLHVVADHLGRPVYTDEQMATYLTQFERDFHADSERGLTTIDATEGGVAKAHTTIMPLAEAIERYAGAAGVAVPEPGAPEESGADPASVRRRLEEVRADVRRIARLSRDARDLLHKMKRDQRDVPRTNRLIDQINAIRDEAQSLSPAFDLVMRLNQMGALKRFKADRAIKLAEDLDAFERQRRQIDRDAMNLQWIAEFADLLDRYIEVADAAFDGKPKITRDVMPQGEDEPAARIDVAPTGHARAVICLDEHSLDVASRDFMGRPILAHTLDRLARAEHISGVTIATGDPAATNALLARAKPSLDATVLAGAPSNERRAASVRAARAWAGTCWRGGLAGTTVFDEAFDPVAASRALEAASADAGVIVGAAWALLDPALTDAAIERHLESPEGNALAFTQAPPGLAPAVVGRVLIDDLAQGARDETVFASIGGALGYIPMRPRTDPIAKPACIQIDAALRATPARFIPDDAITADALEKALAGATDPDAQTIAQAWRRWANDNAPIAPREITLEITTTRPARGDRFHHLGATLSRPDLDPRAAESIIDRALAMNPDVRLTLAGLGDPLEHPACLDIVHAARDRGIKFIHLRTDLLAEPDTIDRLLDAPIDVISVDVLAQQAETYRRITGADAYRRLMENLDRALASRTTHAGMPATWIVPRITRRDDVYEEIEAFFDKWILLAGAAIIDPLPAPRPGERIEPLTPPAFIADRDARHRMTILCDGAVPANHDDLSGAHTIASALNDGADEAWARRWA